MEEEVGVIFHYTTGGTMLVDTGGPGYSFSSGEGPSYQSPSEGFDDGW